MSPRSKLVALSLLIAAGSAPCTAQPASSEPAPHIVPEWRSRPTADDMLRVYPPTAVRRGGAASPSSAVR